VLPTRFATDTSLDALARRMRFLGYDVATFRGVTLEELFDLAGRESRAVLTLSPRHPRRYSAVPARVVPRADLAAALRAAIEGVDPAGTPFSRCALCNTALQARHPLEGRGEIPGRVLRRLRVALYCPQCGKWYWNGSHVDRMCAWLSRTLGRDVTWPHDPPVVPG